MTLYATAAGLSVRKEGVKWVLRRNMHFVLWSVFWECAMYHATRDPAYQPWAHEVEDTPA